MASVRKEETLTIDSLRTRAKYTIVGDVFRSSLFTFG